MNKSSFFCFQLSHVAVLKGDGEMIMDIFHFVHTVQAFPICNLEPADTSACCFFPPTCRHRATNPGVGAQVETVVMMFRVSRMRFSSRDVRWRSLVPRPIVVLVGTFELQVQVGCCTCLLPAWVSLLLCTSILLFVLLCRFEKAQSEVGVAMRACRANSLTRQLRSVCMSNNNEREQTRSPPRMQ